MNKAILPVIVAWASALALGGCVLPAAVSIASLAIDGVSYAATGKSVQDHALSAVADEDCALWRVAAGRSVCVERAETAVASVPVTPPARSRDDGPAAPAETNTMVAASEAAPAAVSAAGGTGGAEASQAAPQGTAVAALPDSGPVPGLAEAGPAAGEDAAPIQMAETSAPAAALVTNTAGPEEPHDAKRGPQKVRPAIVRLAGGAPAATHADGTERERILAAKAAGVGPFGLAGDGSWRPIPSGTGGNLTAAVDAALAPAKGSLRTDVRTADRGVYLVFGTFAKPGKASVAMRRYAEFTTRVVHDSRDGRSLYRVVTGPYAEAEAHTARDSAARNGAPHVWLLTL